MKIFEKYVSTIVKKLAQECTQRGSDPIGGLIFRPGVRESLI